MKLIAAALTAIALALATPAFAAESADEKKAETVKPAETGAAMGAQKAEPGEEPAGTGASSGEAGQDKDPTPGDKSRIEAPSYPFSQNTSVACARISARRRS